ncbi:MAG: lysine exporter LysO family protein [Bacillota bacterium]
MAEIFLALCAGLGLGYYNLFSDWVNKQVIRGMGACLLILLVAMGAKIGADPLMVHHAGLLGIKAFFLAMSAIAGSIGGVLLIERLFLRELATSREITIQTSNTGISFGLIPSCLVAGIAVGYFLLQPGHIPVLEALATWALWLMLFAVGLDLGKNSKTWQQVRQMGTKALLIPAFIAIGSVTGTAVAGSFAGIPIREASAIGAGFGWYSLSGILLTQIYHVETGTLALLTNVAREALAFLLIPIMARKGHKLACVAPGGATTMDTTLPIISREAGVEIAPIAFLSGSILTFLVPVLVPLLIKIGF